MTNPLIKKFGEEKQWINWRFETVNGKKTKVPYASKVRKASTTDASTWLSYEDAAKSLDNGSNGFDGTGIVFTLDKKLLGIDIDHVIEKGKIPSAIEAFLNIANTYTEVSPSGTGLHLLLALTEPFTPVSNKKAPFELYTHGRYFTVTERPFGKIRDVRTVTVDEAETLLKVIGYPWNKKADKDIKATPSDLTDEEVVEKMFASKNGDKVKKLYQGDLSNHKDDASLADAGLCSHLAFWTGRNAGQMERLWLASPLGSRDKTKKRKDYRDRTISNAIEKCTEVYESNKAIEFLMHSKGEDVVPTLCTENICRIFREHPNFKGRLKFNAFKITVEVLGFNETKWRLIEDNDDVVFQTEISKLFLAFQRVSSQMTHDAMVLIAKENKYDPALDYLASVTWDGTARLDTWLTTAYGTPSDEYHAAVGSNWMKGLVKRLVYPGCQFDHVLVLEGPQGVKKSTSLSVLGGDWHAETIMGMDSKDFLMLFGGKAIIEFSEGETATRTDVKRMKSIITTRIDKYRPPYERTSQEFLRRCVFAMTTNDDEYLKDETGNRRWLPIKVLLPEVNIEWLTQNRDQLYAEAYHRAITLKETVYEFPKEETQRQQDLRRVHDENEDAVTEWYFNKLTEIDRKNGITIHQVWRDAINNSFSTKILDKWYEMKIGNILRVVLKLEKRQVSVGGVRMMRWYPKDSEMTPLELSFKDIEETF